MREWILVYGIKQRKMHLLFTIALAYIQDYILSINSNNGLKRKICKLIVDIYINI